jgi:hypothetical protein
MRREIDMQAHTQVSMDKRRRRPVVVVLTAVAWMAMGTPAIPGTHADRSNSQAEKRGAFARKTFDRPEAAIEAVAHAFETFDRQALLEIFGAEHADLIVVTDEIAQREACRELTQAIRDVSVLQENDDGSRTWIIGRLRWPFPIPLVKEGDAWRFDTEAGRDELLNRRIGENELTVIENCRFYLAAQRDYASKDRDGDEVREYAQRLASTKGNQDGLYWETDADRGEELSPFGPLIAEASEYLEVLGKARKAPFKGYYYRILTRQGKHAPGGAYDYIINGNMIAGFALLAAPADYGLSGIMTFMVSHHGKIYEKDLGDETLEEAKKITAFDPDESWRVVDEDVRP